jgi:hypothetical protein
MTRADAVNRSMSTSAAAKLSANLGDTHARRSAAARRNTITASNECDHKSS